MAETIDTTLNVDREGPPEYKYRNYVYVTLPPGFGEIRCEEHRWMEGSEWGIAVGDYNRGEIIGEKATLESRTSEKNDTEDITGNGGRVVIAKLFPGPSFNAGTQVKFTVRHKLWGTLRVQAMSNVEKNPPAVAASADFKWKQFDQVDMYVKATIEADKQKVSSTRVVRGNTETNGKVKLEYDGSGIPEINIEGSAGRRVDEVNGTSTIRTSVDGIDVHQIISEALDSDILSLSDLTTKAFEVVNTCSVASNIGDTEGFADASMKIDHSWVFDFEMIFIKDQSDSGSDGKEEKKSNSFKNEKEKKEKSLKPVLHSN